jgi:hypothetical protein
LIKFSVAELAAVKIKLGFIETKKLIVDGIDIAKRINELSEEVESQKSKLKS